MHMAIWHMAIVFFRVTDILIYVVNLLFKQKTIKFMEHLMLHKELECKVGFVGQIV